MTRDPADLTLIVAGDPGQRTGGYIYDARIVEALRAQCWDVRVVGLDGRFPEPDQRAHGALDEALRGLPDGARVVIDGLAMGGLPEVVAAHADRLDLTALVHHPLADETGLGEQAQRRLFDSEARALQWVHRVIVTSAFTARRLADFRVPPERVHIVEPGVDPAPLASAHEEDEEGSRLLCVASLTPRKGYAVLLEALAGMMDRDWHCEAVGSPDRDPAHAEALFAMARRYDLTERITWTGELDGQALSAAYARSDVLVVASYYEGFGMAVTEALTRGVPVIATTGGALVDTVPEAAGLRVPPGDAAALRAALTRWCDEPALRRTLRQGAQAVRSRMQDWPTAGAAFAAALGLGTHAEEAQG